MSDIILLLLVVTLPAALVLGPLAILGLGVAAVADLGEDGLVRSSGARAVGQPAPGSSSKAVPADGSVTTGPASRISSPTLSA